MCAHPQVLPYIYSHLISMSCTIYLCVSSFLKGLAFSPDASYAFGLCLPLTSTCLLYTSPSPRD